MFFCLGISHLALVIEDLALGIGPANLGGIIIDIVW